MFSQAPVTAALRRFIAAGAACLVLTLTILAAYPAAHEHIHHGCDHDDTHVCAVVLFAHGIWASFEPITAAAPACVRSETVSTFSAELRLPAIPHRLPPERGPPAC